MSGWRPQLYQQQAAAKGIDADLVRAALATARITRKVHPDLPPIFSLRHLAHHAGADYGALRAVVSRAMTDPYESFKLRKRGGRGYRIICVPVPVLMRTQRWIARNVLRLARTHDASVAYAPGSKLTDAAQPHCRARWLLKVDVHRFFESISEISAYRAFRSLGYQPLLSFEMARLVTRLAPSRLRGKAERWYAHYTTPRVIRRYAGVELGHLPQGAPTSPMLANIAAGGLDEAIARIAERLGLVYTRYADDICLSTSQPGFTRHAAVSVISDLYRAMGRNGFSPNIAKTRISPPGARKVVLGLLVNGDHPSLPRSFRDRLRQHLYFLHHPNVGPVKHAQARGFASVRGMRNYLTGLVAFAAQVNEEYGAACRRRLEAVDWPF